MKAQRVVRQHAERRDHVFTEVLVLIVAPHQDEVRAKRADLVPDGPERAEDALAMRGEGADAFVLAPLGAHRLGPARRVAQSGGDTRVALEHSRERPGLVLGGNQAGRVVGRTDAQDLAHSGLSCRGRLRLFRR